MKAQNFPKQSAPVIRQITPASISGEQGVEASFPWDTIKNIAQAAIPAVLSAL